MNISKQNGIIIALIVLNIAILIWAVSCKDRDMKRHNPYSLIDPARNFISQDHFLTTIEPLRRAVKSYAEKENLQASIYIEYLNTGSNIHVNPDFRFWPASLSKVPIAVAVMSTIEDGEWSLDDELTIQEDDIDPYTVTARYSEGQKTTIRHLLEDLLKRSDNTAYRVLLRNLPHAELEEMKMAIGLEEVYDDEGKINAKEYSRFFRMLYTSSYLSRGNSQYLLELMNESEFRGFLHAEVPSNVVFSHKFGAHPEAHAYNDSGIVYVPNRPYLITVVMQGDGSTNEQDKVTEVMSHISKISYAFFSQAK